MKSISVESELQWYRPALGMDTIISRRTRLAMQKVLFFGIVFLSAIVGLMYAVETSLSFQNAAYSYGIADALSASRSRVYALLSLGGALFLVSAMLEAFYNTYYFKGLTYILHETRSAKGARGVTYEVARVLMYSSADITESFLRSPYGIEVMERCNVAKKNIDQFIQTKTSRLPQSSIMVPQNVIITLDHIGAYIIEYDKAFKDFLFRAGVQDEVFFGSVRWVARRIHTQKARMRWWGRDNLARIQGIAKDWGYGGAYRLANYSRDLTHENVYSMFSKYAPYAYEKVEQLEAALVRGTNANALLIGDPGVGKMEIITQLAQMIRDGDVFAPLEHKRVMLFDGDGFIARNPDKGSFELEFIKMLNEAAESGNIIIVILNLPDFIGSARALGSDAAGILSQYISSRALQLVATSDPDSYHQSMLAQSQLMRYFETIPIRASDVSSTVYLLEDVALSYERAYNVLFTYQAIYSIAENADRYFVTGIMPNKAIDLLVELVPYAKATKKNMVTKEAVDEYVSQKVGINIGSVSKDEQGLLLNLENILHERVIGQDEAVRAISGAMRRARAGIQNPNRPMGSFLFLGPTGVGKTETAKALAQVFFGSDKRMLRLDMSEYNTKNALERLIGSFDTGRPGTLSTMLLDKPYGVLLLDEFEKTTDEVKNLFLQVLDEGYFSDMRGKRISARNMIIVATSNAGSDLIWKFMREGKDLAGAEHEIIDSLIAAGIYSPELLNRFDGVVLFHPLTEEHLRIIALHLLEEFKARIKKRGYTIDINDVLVNLLISEGFDPKFGARPMRRVLQERIEEVVASKIIAGALEPGAVISFTEDDFKKKL